LRSNVKLFYCSKGEILWLSCLKTLKFIRKQSFFADEISCLTEDFSKGNYHLTDQLNRAALSIATNIAEGNGRYSKPDRKNFFRISRGSAFECIPILELCKRKKLIEEEKHKTLKENLDEICKMLSGLINY